MSPTASPSAPVGTRPSPLRVYRQALGLTVEDAAALAGISRQSLGSLEHGKSQPRFSTAQALSEVLGAPVETLWPNDERRSPQSYRTVARPPREG